ncbi:cytochrome P450 [Paenibacillus sp. JCM 10914]|uniref:cytochrome P450 family protein n=1 Tax=Paenibacillus sp. JCM 10914 TaxID=1236974 RepID=UPI0003CCA4E9|nr:cytochrome P450 [Paenibacillus sp. JCM 10914]GAE07508.1 putative cytochrome P450 hydroxylase [Paenibacillus sp. JCM 10914]
MHVNESLKNALFTEEFTQNPYPVYENLRQQDPIMNLHFPDGRYGWLISNYDDAVAALKDGRFTKNVAKAYGEQHASVFSTNMLFADPPDHKRLRGLVQKGFTPQRIEGMRDHIQDIANRLLDDIGSRNTMNLIDEYAFKLPIIVISEILGVPLEDQDKFRKWSNSIISASNRETSEEVLIHMKEFIAYLNEWFDKVRKEPGDDMISKLVIAEEEGERLSEQELYGVVTLMIIAGHETTVNLIGNGLLALLEHPEQRTLLQEQPELIHGAIEEMLRYNGPVEFSTSRWAAEDLEFRGVNMNKGDLVVIALNSANRDPKQFDDPDLFDITRDKSMHLAFGKGIHLCLGAPLARMEGEIAINTLLRRYPELELHSSVDRLEWRPGMIVRGVKEIPLSLSRQ